MTSNIQTDRIGTVSISIDLLLGLRRDTIQGSRRRTGRSITTAALLSSVVYIDIAAIHNCYSFVFVGHISIVIVQYGFYQPFTISALPDNGISQHNPVRSFRRFIHCTSEVISVDNDRKVYGRRIGICCGNRIEFFKIVTIIGAPMDCSTLLFPIIRPGENERGERIYDKLCSDTVHDIVAHGNGHGTVCLIRHICDSLGRFRTDVGHHEGFHIHIVGIDSSQCLIRDFHRNGDGCFRFDEVTSFVAERDVVSQHSIIVHAAFSKSCFCFEIHTGFIRNGHNAHIDFFPESTFGGDRCYDNPLQLLGHSICKEHFRLFQEFLFEKFFFRKFL